MSKASDAEGISILHWIVGSCIFTAALILTLMALDEDASSQILPNEPTSIRHEYLSSREVKIEIGANFLVRGLDAYSTHEFHVNPCNCLHENQLPTAIAYHQGPMYLYSFAIAGTVQFGAYELWKHGHPKLSRIVRIADTVSDGSAVAGNFHNIARYGK